MNRYSLHIPRPPLPPDVWDIKVGDSVEVIEGIEKPPTPYPTPLPARVVRRHMRANDGAIYLSVQWANGTTSGWPAAWFKKANS